jgi:DNA-binding transcriptional regulator YiaG
MYHYTESGLPNVYLTNGFEKISTPYGEAVSIHDLEGLHQALARAIVEKKEITGAELRFLRKEMGLSQSGLAAFLGVQEQTVSLWERKPKQKVPATAERFVRVIYLEHVNGNAEVRKLLEVIADLDEAVSANLVLEETEDGWIPRAA